MIVIASRDLPIIKAKLKELGSGTKQLATIRRRAQSVVPPIEREVDKYALAILPKRGGLNQWVADSKVRASVKTGARSAGVYLRMGRNSLRKRADLVSIDKGVVRHPTFGHRGAKVRHALPSPSGFGRHFFITQRRNDWHDEGVTPGFWSFPAEHVGKTEMIRVADQAIAEALRELGLD